MPSINHKTSPRYTGAAGVYFFFINPLAYRPIFSNLRIFRTNFELCTNRTTFLRVGLLNSAIQTLSYPEDILFSVHRSLVAPPKKKFKPCRNFVSDIKYFNKKKLLQLSFGNTFQSENNFSAPNFAIPKLITWQGKFRVSYYLNNDFPGCGWGNSFIRVASPPFPSPFKKPTSSQIMLSYK